MTLSTILIIVLIVLMLGGFPAYRAGGQPVGIVWVILVVVVVILLLRGGLG